MSRWPAVACGWSVAVACACTGAGVVEMDARSNDSVAITDTPTVLGHDHVSPPVDASDEIDDAPDAVPADAVDTVDAERDRSRDLDVRLTGFDGAVGRRAQFRLVGADGRLECVATLDTIASGTDHFTLQNAVIDPRMRLDWWVDDNANGTLDALPVDRAWRTPLPSSQPFAMALGPLATPADISAAPGVPARDFEGHFTGFEPHVGFAFEVTLHTTDTARSVGLLHISSLPASGIVDFVIDGVVRPGVAYTAFWYIDLNRNGRFDRFGDHYATITTMLNATGFVIHHDHHVNRTWQE